MSQVSADPSWLRTIASDAATRSEVATPPDDAEEIWRYSRVADIAFDDYASVADPVSTTAFIDDGAATTVIVRDGWIVDIDNPAAQAAFVGAAEQHPAGSDLFGSVREPSADLITQLHDATVGDPVLIDVPRGALDEGLIVIDSYTDVADGLTAPHTIIRTAAGSSVTVLERRRSGASNQLVIPSVEIDAAPDSRVGYLMIQELGAATTSLERHAIRADQQAHVTAAIAALGGHYARVHTNFRLVGRGASGDLIAAFFGDGDQMLDFRTFQEHAAPDTTSNLLFKGAVTGRAQSVYSGLIRVDDNAPGTNAFQTNRNLKLSDDAWAYSVPNLEIEQNEVSCSHASTVGEIDEDQRFYLESRGIPTTTAEQLLVSGFFAEAIAKMPVDSVKAELQEKIDAALASDRDGGQYMTEPIELCAVDALSDGEIAMVEIEGREIAYARVDGRYFAIDDTCTHAKVSLAGGIVDEDDCTIECPKHGAVFSLETGEALTLPATRDVASHQVEIRESTVYLTVTAEDDDG